MTFRKMILAVFLICGILICPAGVAASDSLVVISGVVRDSVHKKKLAGAVISVPGSNISTVSNDDGAFSIKIPVRLSAGGIRAYRMGYQSASVADLSVSRHDVTVWLQPSSAMLEEVTVYGGRPRELVEKAIMKIPQNYPAQRNMFSSFYRETVQKGRRYISVSEAIVDVLKNPYDARSVGDDKVRIVKGRRLVSQKSGDTVSVKIVGGPVLPVLLDVVKNENALFSLSELDYYEFRMENPVSVDGRRQFVVSFRPRVKIGYALNKGRVYIDQTTLSFSRAEFSLDVSDKEKATRAILFRKPRGLRFNPQEIDFIVSYKYQDGLSYLSYIRMKTRFKCDWKRRLFSSGYTTYAEMVMVDRTDNPSQTIRRKESFGQNDIFCDMVDGFGDTDFWKDYNIIEPTESLEKAVLKLKNWKK